MLLASSTGISYAQHFCGEYEMLSEITLGKKELSCGMVMEVPICDDEDIAHNCCDNQYTQVETDDTFTKVSFDVTINAPFIFYIVSNYELTETNNFLTQNIEVTEDGPPLVVKDLQILYETFLI